MDSGVDAFGDRRPLEEVPTVSEFIEVLALILWCAALTLLLHPQSRQLAPRGIAGSVARQLATQPGWALGPPNVQPPLEDSSHWPPPPGLGPASRSPIVPPT